MKTGAVGKTLMMAAAAVLSGAGAACSTSGGGGSNDPVVQAPAHYSVVLENDAVRVLRIRYAPGDRTEMHHHPDAIVVALSGSQTRFTLPDGNTEDAALADNEGRYMPAGDHSPENVGTAALDAILIEFKRAQPGTAALPGMREGQTMEAIAEGSHASAYRIVADPAFAEPEGTTHEFDQVVIAMAPAEVALSVEGQAPRTSWTRGDVAFIPRNTPHSSRNTSGAPAEYVLVMIK